MKKSEIVIRSTMNTYSKSGGTGLLIHNLGTRGRRMAIFMFEKYSP